MEKIQNLCTKLYVVGKTGLGKNLTPAGARWEKLVLALVLVPSGRSGKERTAGVTGSSAPSPQVSGNGNKDLYFFGLRLSCLFY